MPSLKEEDKLDTKDIDPSLFSKPQDNQNMQIDSVNSSGWKQPTLVWNIISAKYESGQSKQSSLNIEVKESTYNVDLKVRIKRDTSEGTL
jgi:hypothetical protein